MAITTNTIKQLGIETVVKFAGCISVNYLLFMNGGMSGYSLSQLEKVKQKQAKYVAEHFDDYINSVVNTINKTATTTTDKYLKKAYLEWYA